MRQAVDPVRAGKITGMLLDLEVHQIVPLNVHKIVLLIIFPDMVRSSSPGSRLHSPTPARLRPLRCRSYLTASRRRKGCWSVHISMAATDPTHSTPTAPSQLTVLRHVPARTQIGHSSAMSRFPRPYSLHVGDIERVAQG